MACFPEEENVHLLFSTLTLASSLVAPGPVEELIDEETIARIKIEGFQRSQVMDLVFQLTDVYGPRLHGSRITTKAALWSRDRLREWGLDSAELESWPSPVPGWSLTAFSIEILEPSYQRLIGYPMAWTPGTDGVVEGVPVLVSIAGEGDFEAHRGKLRAKSSSTETGILTDGRASGSRRRDRASAPPSTRAGRETTGTKTPSGSSRKRRISPFPGSSARRGRQPLSSRAPAAAVSFA
jgi:hypothetical protein